MLKPFIMATGCGNLRDLYRSFHGHVLKPARSDHSDSLHRRVRARRGRPLRGAAIIPGAEIAAWRTLSDVERLHIMDVVLPERERDAHERRCRRSVARRRAAQARR